MKIFIYVLMGLIAAIITMNIFKLDFSNLFQGDSSIALVSILSGLCAFLILAIFLISKKIESKVKESQKAQRIKK